MAEQHRQARCSAVNEPESLDEEADEAPAVSYAPRCAFAAWVGPSCPACGMPVLLHGTRCDDTEETR